ncbi:MAG: hypothetical protein ACXWC7_15050 [Chitinophagaceae bacterium]
MLKEEYLQQLLSTLYEKGSLDVYDYTAGVFKTESEEFANTKSWSDQLVRDKLATYADAEHTILNLTNHGKYWILKGGYESFLKDGQSTKDHHKDKEDEKEKLFRREKEELTEARLRLTHYRLVGFWLTIVVSSLGFLLSLVNLYLIMKGKK